MRRNREPGTRKPLSCPESKQRIIVCWLTLQILAASPVVKTVFISTIPLAEFSSASFSEIPGRTAGKNSQVSLVLRVRGAKFAVYAKPSHPENQSNRQCYPVMPTLPNLPTD